MVSGVASFVACVAAEKDNGPLVLEGVGADVYEEDAEGMPGRFPECCGQQMILSSAKSEHG